MKSERENGQRKSLQEIRGEKMHRLRQSLGTLPAFGSMAVQELGEAVQEHIDNNIHANTPRHRQDTNFDLSDILAIPHYTMVFRDYLELSFCCESLNFLVTVRGFETTKFSQNEDDLEERAFYIFKEYVDSNAPQLVNLDSITVDELSAKFAEDDLSQTVFTKAADCVYKMINNDVFNRFKISPMCAEMKKMSVDELIDSLVADRQNKFPFNVAHLEENYKNIFKIAEKLSQSPICKTRRLGLLKHKRCMSAQSIVDWFIHSQLAASRMAGVCLAQRLIDSATLSPIDGTDLTFRDSSADYFQLVEHRGDKKWPTIVELLSKPKTFYGEILIRGVVRYNRVWAVVSPKDRMLFMWRCIDGTSMHSSIMLKQATVIIHMKKDSNYMLTFKRRASAFARGVHKSKKMLRGASSGRTHSTSSVSISELSSATLLGPIFSSPATSPASSDNESPFAPEPRVSKLSMVHLQDKQTDRNSFGGSQSASPSSLGSDFSTQPPGKRERLSFIQTEDVEDDTADLCGFYVTIKAADGDECCLKIESLQKAKSWETAFFQAKANVQLVKG